MLGPLMFLLYINDIGENTKAQIGLCADDAVLYGVIKVCNDAKSPQQDLNALDTGGTRGKCRHAKYAILRVSCSKSPVEYQYSVQRRAVRFVKNEYSTTHWNCHENSE